MMQLHVEKCRIVYKIIESVGIHFGTKMSCDYANGLSDYDDKGVLGVPEVNKSENIETVFFL